MVVNVDKTAKKSTVKRCCQALNDYVLPVVGSKRVDEIRKADIADALEIAQDKRKSTSTWVNPQLFRRPAGACSL